MGLQTSRLTKRQEKLIEKFRLDVDEISAQMLKMDSDEAIAWVIKVVEERARDNDMTLKEAIKQFKAEVEADCKRAEPDLIAKIESALQKDIDRKVDARLEHVIDAGKRSATAEVKQQTSEMKRELQDNIEKLRIETHERMDKLAYDQKNQAASLAKISLKVEGLGKANELADKKLEEIKLKIKHQQVRMQHEKDMRCTEMERRQHEKEMSEKEIYKLNKLIELQGQLSEPAYQMTLQVLNADDKKVATEELDRDEVDDIESMTQEELQCFADTSEVDELRGRRIWTEPIRYTTPRHLWD